MSSTCTGHAPVSRTRFAFNKLETFRSAGYRPSRAQLEFHNSSARFRTLIAGSRFGKSLAAAMEIAHQALAPHCTIWIVAPTYLLAMKEFTYAIDALRKLGALRGATLRGLTGSSRAEARLANGTVISTRSAENPDSLLAEEVDLMVIAEAARIAPDVYRRHLRMRLGSRRGHLIVPTTPDGAGGWVHDMFLQGQASDPALQDYASFGPYAVTENPAFPRDELELARRTVPPMVFEEQYLGLFVRRSGLVYPEFRPRTHTFTDADLPTGVRDWPVWCGIDFGYRNPFVCLWAARDSTGRWWVLKELYQTGLLVQTAAQMIRERSGGMRVRGMIADHDSEDRATLRRHGVKTTAAIKPVMPGIRSVKAALMPVVADAPPDANGQVPLGGPGLMIHESCRHTIMEFSEYSWDDGTALGYADFLEAGGGQAAPRPEDAPKKCADHAMDALRYLIHTTRERGL